MIAEDLFAEFEFERKHRWAIILAGGEGERLRPLVEKWLGYHRPKQYCAFVGSRTMLQHTLDRTRRIVPVQHILTVIGRGHWRYLWSARRRDIPGRIIEQPDNLGTAPGIFLPAAYIMAKDPTATVLIFPSDHFVLPEELFLLNAARAARLARHQADRVVLLGARPDRPDSEFGWILPGRKVDPCSCSPTARHVSAFQEKPSLPEAERFLQEGYLWNTLVIAAQIRALWALGWQTVPELMDQMENLRTLWSWRYDHTSRKAIQSALFSAFRKTGIADFSRQTLQRCPGRTLVLPMEGVIWNDWGSPARVLETLHQFGEGGRFPATRSGEMRMARTARCKKESMPRPPLKWPFCDVPAVTSWVSGDGHPALQRAKKDG